MDGNSLTPQQIKLEEFKKIFPEAFCEGKVDWEKLKATLGEDINFENERYVLNWAGKSQAFKTLQTPTTKTLKPAKDESVDFDNTEHIFIEGENLEVLKILQKSYFGKIKMIYIDPPYNTGNDSFIYPDKFSETLKEYQQRVGDKDAEGCLIKDGMFKKNAKENGQYHSNWLNMMYPRLFLAKNLLKQDGVIFVSIDDNEVHNLKLLMNEVFGEENFVGLFTVNSSPSGIDYGHIAKVNDYALFYTKNIDYTLTNYIEEKDKKFKYNDDISGFNIAPLYNGNVAFNPVTRPNLYYPFYLNPTKADENCFYEIDTDFHENWIKVYPVISKKDGVQRVWRWGKPKSNRNKNVEIVGYKNNTGEYRIVQKNRLTSKMIRSILLENIYASRSGTAEMQNLFEKKVFSYPKPTGLIKTLSVVGSNDGDIILDFFSGSGTTAHAVMALNAEDGGTRKCISVQLPELTDEKSEAFKAGYKTIADIAKERIRRAAQKIQAENPDYHGDLGFKVLKLTDSNFKQWQQVKDNNLDLITQQLDAFVDPVRDTANTENMVVELLLKNGMDLNAKIVHKKGYITVNDNELTLLLEEVNQDIITAVLSQQPQKVIALDRLFKDNDPLKTNTALQMRDADITLVTI